MHSIEKELIKATEYKARTKFVDRQDYLGSILNACTKLSDDDFDHLTDDAAAWVNASIAAHNSRKDIPEFDDDFEDSEEAEDDTADDSGDEPDDDSEADEADDEGDEADEAADGGGDELDGDEDDPEDDPEPKPVKAKPAKAAKAKPAPKLKPPPKEVKVPKVKFNPDDEPDVIIDKWGCMEGSKNSQALDLFEKGATAKEVKVALNGTYYNILKKMAAAGHRLEKEGSLIKITHKDDLKAGPAAKPATKAKKK